MAAFPASDSPKDVRFSSLVARTEMWPVTALRGLSHAKNTA
jgi:hypothetical protein